MSFGLKRALLGGIKIKGTFRSGVKDGQYADVLNVAVLNTMSSRLPIPTTFPAHT